MSIAAGSVSRDERSCDAVGFLLACQTLTEATRAVAKHFFSPIFAHVVILNCDDAINYLLLLTSHWIMHFFLRRWLNSRVTETLDKILQTISYYSLNCEIRASPGWSQKAISLSPHKSTLLAIGRSSPFYNLVTWSSFKYIYSKQNFDCNPVKLSSCHLILVYIALRNAGLTRLLSYIRHLYVSSVWFRCGYKNGHYKDICFKRLDCELKFINHSTFNNQQNWGAYTII